MKNLCRCNTACRKQFLGSSFECRLDRQLAPFQEAYNNRVTRKVFVCVGCEGLYGDEPVSQCDCMLEPPRFIETTVTYQKASDEATETSKALDKLTQESQDMGLYNPPFTNPMIKTETKGNE